MNKNTEFSPWGIHGDKNGDADTLLLKENCVAVGWTKMGDLASCKPDRDAFKALVVDVYPEKNRVRSQTMKGSCSNWFTEVGDIVVFLRNVDGSPERSRIKVMEVKHSPLFKYV